MNEETVGSAEIIGDLILARIGLAEAVWVILDGEHWLVEGYGVLGHDGQLLLFLGATDGSDRTYELPAGERLPRYRLSTTEEGPL